MRKSRAMTKVRKGDTVGKITLLIIVAAFVVPVFRCGLRTNLTAFEWLRQHTIWGNPVQYVPEEKYAEELSE